MPQKECVGDAVPAASPPANGDAKCHITWSRSLGCCLATWFRDAKEQHIRDLKASTVRFISRLAGRQEVRRWFRNGVWVSGSPAHPWAIK